MIPFTKSQNRNRELGIDLQLMDKYYIEREASERSIREAKKTKIVAWISTLATVVAAIATVITLFKS